VHVAVFKTLGPFVKVLITAVVLSLAAASASRAEVVCTLIVDAESGAVRLQEGGGCDTPTSPASTFKVPLAVMGFDAGILSGADEPAWPYRAEYKADRADWKVTTTPTTWLRDSVLWYSRVLVAEMGAERFGQYVADFDYGNADISGDPGKNNSLLRSWINSSLLITPEQQVRFVRRMLAGELPASATAQAAVVAIMPSFRAGNWTVSGKTGTYYERNADGTFNSRRQTGWFVGWAERDGERLAFAYLIRDTKKAAGPAGLRARDALLARFAKWGKGEFAWAQQPRPVMGPEQNG
jgi:beta-lactamase class D